MSRWFRVYSDMVDEPKVQRLPPPMFKALVNLWCLASAGGDDGGQLPPLADIAFKLRVTDDEALQIINDLTAAGLLDDEQEGYRPHNWNGRQFKSDVSNERVQRYRKRHRNVTRNENETPPETETETETEKVASQPSAREAESANLQIALKRGERTRGRLDQIERECREAAGLENDPSPSLLDISPIVTLIDVGYDFARDILPKLREMHARGKHGRTWAYYVPAITEGKAANGAIQPKAVIEPAKVDTVWLTEDDPQFPQAKQRFREIKGRDPPLRGSRYRTGVGYDFPKELVSG